MKIIDKEFYRLIRTMIKSEEFVEMKTHRHHVKGSVFDHSVKVAYLCYRHCKRFGTRVDLREMVRGALLHDYYLYDRRDKSQPHKLHGIMHPRQALANAVQKYPDLSATERDMIRRHMFPLTLVPPKTKSGRLLCFYDKVAAIDDYCRKSKWKHRRECVGRA